MSLDELGATLNLALVVASLQLVALNWLLGNEREGYKLVHEHVEHRVVVTPVAVFQPEPLEQIFLLHGNELLSQGIHVDALSHLLLNKGYETFWIDFHFCFVGDRAACNIDAPTIVLVLDECRMGIHHQLAQLALRWNLVNHSKALALVAYHQLGILVAQNAEINQFVLVELQGETVVVVIAHKLIAVVIYLVVRNLNLLVHLVVLSIIERETDVRNHKVHGERLTLFRNQSQAQALVAEVFLLANKTIVGFLCLLHLHVAMAPVDVEGDGAVILGSYLNEVVDVLTQIDHGGRFVNLRIVVLKWFHLNQTWHWVIFPFLLFGSGSRFENEENHSLFLLAAIFAAKEYFRLLWNEERSR